MSDPRADLSIDEGVDVPPNPEVDHVASVAQATREAQGGNMMSTVHHRSNPQLSVGAVRPDGSSAEPEGALYVTRNVPDMVVEVMPSQNVVVPEDHEVSVAGSYWDGDQFKTHGPTAHMMEARGFVRVLGVAKEQCSKPVEPDGGES